MSKSTIHDVAARAGVSLMTVSRVVNESSSVAPDTRRRVLAAVEELGFRPSRTARNLRARRSRWITMLSMRYPAGSNLSLCTASYLAELQAGAIARCRQQQYHISFDRCDPQDAAEVAGLTRALGPDGVLLVPPLSSSQPLLAELARLDMPVVRVAPAQLQGTSPCVYMDDQLAAREMTVHLIALGHRRIGFLRGHPQHVASELRLAGFRQAMRAAGLKPAPRHVQAGDFTAISGAVAARVLLADTTAAVTAIFASNDDMAAGALSVAHELGLRVPQEISIVGFDDTYVAAMLWPALTTVRQPIFDMGFSATHQLLALVGGGKATQRTALSHDIVKRDSAAAPAGAGAQAPLAVCARQA